MFLSAGLVLALVLAANVANGEEYTFVHMTDAKPYTEIPCPEKCGSYMDMGLKATSLVLGTILSDVGFDAGFSENCRVGGMGNFAFTHKCYMNKDETIFDHPIDVSFHDFYITCNDKFSNSPSKMAEKINSGKIIKGKCGRDNYENKQECKLLQCDGNQDGESDVTFSAKFKHVNMSTIIRVDTNDKNPGAFPIKTSLVTDEVDNLSYEGPSEFGDSMKCMSQNPAGVFCRMFANFQTPFYACFGESDSFNIVHMLLYMSGKC